MGHYTWTNLDRENKWSPRQSLCAVMKDLASSVNLAFAVNMSCLFHLERVNFVHLLRDIIKHGSPSSCGGLMSQWGSINCEQSFLEDQLFLLQTLYDVHHWSWQRIFVSAIGNNDERGTSGNNRASLMPVALCLANINLHQQPICSTTKLITKHS